jgi:hypothetical protein
MYQLWAKRRPVEGVGFPYEYIFSFDNEDYKYTAIDQLDRSIYQEAMIVSNEACVLYVEFEKPMVYRRNYERR